MRWASLVVCACSFHTNAGIGDGASDVAINPNAPPTPTDVVASSIGCGQVRLVWTPSPGATGYTVYRDGAAIASPTTNSYVDAVAPATTYQYTVDAVGAAGHSAASAPATVITTPPCAQIQFVVADAQQNGGSSVTLSFSNIAAGDLLVGWFLGYQTASPVVVSDSVNGLWTRGCAGIFDNGAPGAGDVALYYVASSAAGSFTITASALGASFMQASAAAYRGTAATSPLDQCVVHAATSAMGLVGPTGTLASAGELVFAATVNGNPQTNETAGAGFTLRISDNNDGCEDRIATSIGAQAATLAFSASTDWNMVVATFRPM